MSEVEQNKQINNKTICLFDVDGTLAPAQSKIQDYMLKTLNRIKSKVKIGIVSGNPKTKFIYQLGEELFNEVDYCFTQNGLVSFAKGKNIHTKSIKDWFGDEKLKKFLNFCLKYIADLDIPIKRGTFIDLRTGLLNISPIGRNCLFEQRLPFFQYDKEHKVRQNFISALKKQFPQSGLQYSTGGQISLDVYPRGWDKRYCLQFLENEFEKIYFFGDRVQPGGNDYEIYEDKRTIGYQVKSPEQTCEILNKLFPE